MAAAPRARGADNLRHLAASEEQCGQAFRRPRPGAPADALVVFREGLVACGAVLSCLLLLRDRTFTSSDRRKTLGTRDPGRGDHDMPGRVQLHARAGLPARQALPRQTGDLAPGGQAARRQDRTGDLRRNFLRPAPRHRRLHFGQDVPWRGRHRLHPDSGHGDRRCHNHRRPRFQPPEREEPRHHSDLRRREP